MMWKNLVLFMIKEEVLDLNLQLLIWFTSKEISWAEHGKCNGFSSTRTSGGKS